MQVLTHRKNNDQNLDIELSPSNGELETNEHENHAEDAKQNRINSIIKTVIIHSLFFTYFGFAISYYVNNREFT